MQGDSGLRGRVEVSRLLYCVMHVSLIHPSHPKLMWDMEELTGRTPRQSRRHCVDISCLERRSRRWRELDVSLPERELHLQSLAWQSGRGKTDIPSIGQQPVTWRQGRPGKIKLPKPPVTGQFVLLMIMHACARQGFSIFLGVRLLTEVGPSRYCAQKMFMHDNLQFTRTAQ